MGNVIGKPRGFAPGRSEAGVPLNLAFVGQGFDPTQAIGIGPDWVVDAGKIYGEFAASFF